MRSKADQHQQDQVAIVWQAFQGNILQYLGSDKFYKIISPFVPKNTFLGELSAYVLGIALILYTSRWNAWSTWTILLIEMKSHQGNGCELLPVKARLQAIGSPAISSWGAQMTGALFGLARQISLTTWKRLYNRNVLTQNWLILFRALPKLLHCTMCSLHSMFVNLPTKQAETYLKIGVLIYQW